MKAANLQLQKVIAAREQVIADLDAFAHMVAHDLKNPLNTVTFSSAWLIDYLEGTADETAQEFLKGIQQSAVRMERIINQLLILASVRQQELTLRPLDMAAILAEVEEGLAFMIQEYRAEIIKPDTWPVALGHATWIEEVWTNYIANAIKYGGVPPRIELNASPEAPGKIRFWVKDNGNGIAPEEQGKLFKEFSRLDNIHTKGYGLGLSVVKRIVEKLGGEVGIESQGRPGEGSTFSFTLHQGEI